jgi:phosphoribosylglycinamide formyltransferase-1
MLSVAVLASGRGTNLQALLEAERADQLGPASIDVVVSDSGDARALERAESFDVETVFVDPDGKDRETYDAELVDVLEDRGVDLVVLAGFMRILSSRFLSSFPDRVINIHPSLLPAFPGLDPQRRALEAGVRVAGATTHFVTEDVDAGPIILQSAVPVRPDDDEESLSRRILETEHRILPASVRLFAEGRLSIEEARVEIKGTDEVPGEFVPEVASDG